MWSSTHVSMASSVGGPGEIGCFARGRMSEKGRSGRQTKSGASWSELLVPSEHVPDRAGKAAGDVDLGDLRPALLAEPLLRALVARRVGGMAKRVHRRLEQGPAQVGRTVLGQGPATIGVTRLDNAGAEAGVAGELLGAREPADVADLGGDREREHPPNTRDAQQQGNVGVVGVTGLEPAVDLVDLVLEMVDQLDAGADVRAPGLGDVELPQEPAPLGPEQIGDRAGSAEVDQG